MTNMFRNNRDEVCLGDKFKDANGNTFQVKSFNGQSYVWCECCAVVGKRTDPLSDYDSYFFRDQILVDRINKFYSEITDKEVAEELVEELEDANNFKSRVEDNQFEEIPEGKSLAEFMELDDLSK